MVLNLRESAFISGAMTDEQVLEAIRACTAQVFSTQLNVQVSPGDCSQHAELAPLTGVVALLGFTGEWTGTGIFYCHEELACRLSSVMLLADIREVTAEVLDGIGELANMILGNVKTRLEPLTGPLGLSIPTVIYGFNFRTHAIAHNRWLAASFRLGDDSFQILICLCNTGIASSRMAG